MVFEFHGMIAYISTKKKNNLKVRNWKFYLCVLNNAASDDKRGHAHRYIYKYVLVWLLY